MYVLGTGMATSSKGRARESRKDSGSLSHTQSSPVSPEVIKKTRAVLLSCTKGVLLKRFSRDYASLAGMSLLYTTSRKASLISV